MAQRTSITYVSDLSGAAIKDNDTPTLNFGWDGTDYTIDLTAKEAEDFYKAVSKYVDAATKVKSTNVKRKNGRTTVQSDYNAADVRGWAKEQGIDVPDRGRIPAAVLEQYNAR